MDSELPVVLTVLLVGPVKEDIKDAVDVIMRQGLGNLGLGGSHDFIRWVLLPSQEGEPLVLHDASFEHVFAEVADLVVVVVSVVHSEARGLGAIAHGGLASPVGVGLVAVVKSTLATLVGHHHPVEASEVGIESSLGLGLGELHGHTVSTHGVDVLWVANLLVPFASKSLLVKWNHVFLWWAAAKGHFGLGRVRLEETDGGEECE